MIDDPTLRMASAIARVDLPGLRLRATTDHDAGGLNALVAAAYDEFACGPLDPAGFDADLSAPGTFATERGRAWWVVEQGGSEPGQLVASVAHGSVREDASHGRVVELHRLYLAPQVRGAGLASALVVGVLAEARRAGAEALEAWSDTRLRAAHGRYLALGFRRTGEERELNDPACTTEVRFLRTLKDIAVD